MKAAVLVFPGSNCDRDTEVALRAVGAEVVRVWHQESALPSGLDLIAVPGGFSYGDYLRSGAMAGAAPLMREVAKAAEQGRYVLGICNGFQILTEAGLLPGALLRNQHLRFICEDTPLSVANRNTAFTARLGEAVRFPIAHMDGAFYADPATISALEGEGRVAFRYQHNPNGSLNDIAGVLSENGRVLGLMPHPERAAEPMHGGTDGAALFQSLMEAA